MKFFTRALKVFFRKNLMLTWVILYGTVSSIAQTSPSPYALSSGSWTLTGWNSGTTSGYYPVNGAAGAVANQGAVSGIANANMAFWKHGSGDPAVSAAPTANYTLAYTNASGTIYGNGANGIGFNNTGGAGIGSAVLALNTTGRTDITVKWTGRNITTGARPYSIKLLYRVGNTGAFVDASVTASNTLYTSGAIGSLVMPTIVLPSDANNKAVVQLLWYFNYIGPSTGTRPEMGLDDITVSSIASGLSAPILTSQPTATVDSPFSITYTADSAYSAAITGITVNGSTVTYSLGAGAITFTPSANVALQSSGTKAIVITATGYSQGTVSQTLAPGAATALSITTQPTGPASNGGVLATQPQVTLKDQYNNITSGTVTAAASGTTYTLGGTTSAAAANSAAVFTNLTAAGSGAVSGATITFTSGALSQISSAFNIPGPPAVITLASDNPASVAGNIAQNTTGNLLYTFSLSNAAGSASANLTAATITTTGTYLSAGITNLKLLYGTTPSIASATLVKTLTTVGAAGNKTFNAFTATATIAGGATGYFFITADFGCVVPGNTIGIDAVTTANLTLSAGTKSGTAFAGSTMTFVAGAAVNVTAQAATVAAQQSVVSWTAPTCYTEVLVVASATSANTGAPTGDASAYTANPVFGSGSTINNGFVVYKGTGTSVTVTGLTNGTTYYYKIFTRNGNNWSTGVEVNSTPALVYCSAVYSSGCSLGDYIKSFTLNTLSNTNSNCNGSPSSTIVYPSTAFTTNLVAGSTYSANVTIGDGGSGNVAIWIDFNDNGQFEDTERFSNTALIPSSGTSSISVVIPGSALAGQHRLRVREIYSLTFGQVVPCTTAEYGEAEDYTITIIANTIPAVTTAATSAITTNSATSGGNVTADNGFAVTAHGVVWSTTSAPTIALSTKTIDGTGTGNFISLITGLIPDTQYYVRAYAQNASGVAYGNEVTFRTLALTAPVAGAGTSITPNSFVANWSAVPGASDYRIDVSTSSTFGTSAPGTTITETFENIGGGASSSYFTRTWTGVNGIGWTAYKSRTDQSIDNSGAITLRNEANAYIISDVISGGLSHISFVAQQFFAGSGGVLTITVLTGQTYEVSTVVGTLSYSETASSFASGTLSINGNYKIRIDNNTSARVGIDNLSFTSMPVNVPSFLIENGNAGSGTSFEVTGLTENTTYYYRVRAVSGTATSPNSNTISVTTKPAAVTWNGTSWSNTTGPDADIEAIIAGDYNTTAVNAAPAGNGIFTAKKLTVTAGSLTVAAGTDLTIVGALVNELTQDKVVIESNANLLQGGTANTNSGAVTVLRESSPLFRQDYTMWSSPVSGAQTFAEFSPETIATRFYQYNTFTDLYSSVSAAQTFATAKGYLIRVPNTFVPYVDETSVAQKWTAPFIGTPNNGTITYDLDYLTDGAITRHYNAVGNPYPSSMSLSSFLSANSSAIEGTLWFWRKRNDSTNTQSYITCTTSGCTETNGNTNLELPVIATGQGFIVKALSAGTLNFTNAMRSDANSNEFFRANATAAADRFWLSLKDVSNNDLGQNLIAYEQNATLGYDSGKDGLYLNDSPTALTSMASDKEVVIQARPSFVQTDVVPMIVKIETAGNYSIALSQLDGVFVADQDILVRDNQTNTVHNLKESAYTFVTAAGAFSNRFEILYQSSLSTSNPALDAKNLVIYKQGSGFAINSGNQIMSSVKVFDIRGRLLNEKTAINASEYTIDGGSTNQVLIVQITLDDNTVVTRKVVN